MRAVVQRVCLAEVEIEGEHKRSIGRGLLVFLGVAEADAESDAVYLAEKVANLRIFDDPDGRMNLSVRDVDASALVVPNFTLYGDCRKGRRPSYTQAAGAELGNRLYERFVRELQSVIPVQTGEFQATMKVTLRNDGPVTLLLDSRKQF
ncbi:MAG: D-tyrosyl-tRNA(Tyr) deacylase [Armatimonadetes bacterium CG2_30_59_28]|nr:D-tyrosyl-tRNA(Tyr) deacylase [Armatimonadota bacterium]OIO98123.1 MAG: D-tyrosyl-tRNA(Tyr) deacylase [Armatimonadetes bacterium CG2_30_59_28]PIU63599.1 MAG: D-tyrosyl-tRNA(Tyr) deacylase [Armatimonadetes bacterium CG07_land_8_20_14_0_80_59_28]PIY41339.1 MAG: D-tyrosyl-tRNA(Tyr) deacylase [Armatimonadetes bacterium CG_4_10_14_3_um_filter_59_10]